MRHVLLVLGAVLLIALAGCAAEDPAGDTPDDLTDDADDGTDAESDETGEPDRTGETDPADDPDRDTDDDPPPVPTGELEIHHIDVGQADATLIVSPGGETILIDSGHWQQDGAGVIEYLEDNGIDRIDHLIATHAHADHIGGHAAVIEWAETDGEGIGVAYDSGVPHTTQTYENYLDAVEAHDVELLFVEEGDELPLESDGLTGLVLNPPEGESGDDLHENSVSIVFEFGEFRYLTTGDAEADAEARMVDDWADELTADVYHAGHHGSSTSSTQTFLETADPTYAIVSSDFDSQFGHPHDEVLERFGDMDIETYWTGVHGDIVVRTDGETVEVTPAEEFSSDPADLLAAKETAGGDNPETNGHWGDGEDMWPEEGDVIALMDPDGNHMFTHPFGDHAYPPAP